MDDAQYYRELAAAYVRGMLPELAHACVPELLAAGRERGLRLRRFKRTAELPRVRMVLGVLKGFAPATLLDVGSGRGAFLWPLLDELPALDVTAIDVLQHRVDDINTVARGGVQRLRGELVAAEQLPWERDQFDAATVLEVLEHVAEPGVVASELVRVARSVVIASVPAKPDDNPEHIRLFDRDTLASTFRDAGAREVRVEHVLNHMIAVVRP